MMMVDVASRNMW